MSNWDRKSGCVTEQPVLRPGTNRNGTPGRWTRQFSNLSQLTNKGDNVRDGQSGNISLGRYNSIFIGGTAHESATP